MISKCNTSQGKSHYSPYNIIKVSQFIQNQEECGDYSSSCNDNANDELNLNILKIKECKKQTQYFINEMNQRIINQNEAITIMQQRSRVERQKSKTTRMKYQEALINLRRKEEQIERLQRSLRECKEKYEFVMISAGDNMNDWLQREDKYKNRIAQLQQIIHQQASITLFSQKVVLHRNQQDAMQGHSKQLQSTFF